MSTLPFHKSLQDCPEFLANDGCHIREWVHPDRDDLALPYSLAHARVDPGKQTYAHFLKQDELYVIQAGSGELHVSKHPLSPESLSNKRERHVLPVTQGSSVLVPAGHEQFLVNTGNESLQFLVIVSPAWCEEDDIRT